MTDAHVLPAVSITGGYPSRAPLHAVYSTQAKGRSDISTVIDMTCLHGHPACSVPQVSESDPEATAIAGVQTTIHWTVILPVFCGKTGSL